MSLRKKILLINFIVLSIILSLILVVARAVFLNNYLTLENQAVQRDIQRFIYAYQSELNYLDVISSDWAAWDDTYQFIQDGNQEYINSNLVTGTYESLNLDFIIFLDRNGTIVYGHGYDSENQTERIIPESLRSLIKNDTSITKHDDISSSKTGLFNLPEGFLTIVSRPILTSETQGPIMGTIIMAKYLSSEEISNLQQITQLHLEQILLDSSKIPSDLQATLQDSTTDFPSTIQPINDKIINGYVLVRDFQSKPAFFILIQEPRNYYQQGLNHVYILLLFMLLTGAISSTVVFFTFNQQVLSRLGELINTVKRVRKEKKWQERILIKGNDELSSLGHEVNLMLDTRQKLDEAARQSEERYRNVVESQLELISRMQTDGTFTFANESYCRYFQKNTKSIINHKFSSVFSMKAWKVLKARFASMTPSNPTLLVEEKDITQTNRESWQQWINTGTFDSQGNLIEIQSVGRDITDRKKVEFQLEHRLKFEQLLIEVATSFINLDMNTIDKGINDALERIGKFAGVDRSYVFLFHPDNDQLMDMTHEWCESGITPFKNEQQNMAVESIPWFMSLISEKKTIFIPKVSELPPAASQEKILFESQSIKSLVCFPIAIGVKLIGFIGFDSVREERKWSDEILILLESTAITMANALEHKRNQDEIQRRQVYLTNLNEITRSSIEGTGLTQVLDNLIERLCHLIESSGAYIFLWNKSGKFIKTGIHINNKCSVFNRRLNEKFFSGLHHELAGDSLLIIENPKDLPTKLDHLLLALNAQALIGLPLASDTEKLGIACLTYDQPHHFTPQEVDVCTQAATQLSLAILKLTALETAQRRAEELNVLRANIIDISSELEFPRLLQSILDRSINLLNASGGDLCLYEPEGDVLRTVAARNLGCNYIGVSIPQGVGGAGKVMVSREPLLIKDYNKWEGRSNLYVETYIHCALIVPMMVGEKLMGVISLFQSDPRKKFTNADLNLLNLFAQQAAIAVDNAHLFQQVESLARTDGLTGLINRQTLEEMGVYEINRAQRTKNPFSLAMIDLDNFKCINDNYSHAIGDQALRQFALNVRQSLRNVDILGRFGGDELMVIMPETDSAAALVVAERLRAKIEKTQFETDAGPMHLTVSIGIISISDETGDLLSMQKLADQAMYQAKQAGRNAVRVYKANVSKKNRKLNGNL